MDDLLDEVGTSETTEAANVEASQDAAGEEAQGQESETTCETPTPAASAPAPSPAQAVMVTVSPAIHSAWTPDPALMAKYGEMMAELQRAEDLEQLAKDAAADYREKIKAAETRAKTLRHEIQDEAWFVEYRDEDGGVVHMRNRLDGATKTRPWEPAPQRELPFDRPLSPPKPVAPELEGVEIGLCGETKDEHPFRVKAVAPDSVVIEFCDGVTQRVEAAEWAVFEPDPDIDQQEYVDEFERARDERKEQDAEWEQGILANLTDEGQDFESVVATLLDGESEDDPESEDTEGRTAARDALDRLIDAGKVVGTLVDGGTLYSLAPEKSPEADSPAPDGKGEFDTPEGQSILKALDEEGVTADEVSAATGIAKKRVKAVLAAACLTGLATEGRRSTGKAGKPPTTYPITARGKAQIRDAEQSP